MVAPPSLIAPPAVRSYVSHPRPRTASLAVWVRRLACGLSPNAAPPPFWRAASLRRLGVAWCSTFGTVVSSALAGCGVSCASRADVSDVLVARATCSTRGSVLSASFLARRALPRRSAPLSASERPLPAPLRVRSSASERHRVVPLRVRLSASERLGSALRSGSIALARSPASRSERDRSQLLRWHPAWREGVALPLGSGCPLRLPTLWSSRRHLLKGLLARALSPLGSQALSLR